MSRLLSRTLLEDDDTRVLKVASGDSLSLIGARFKVSPELLQRINGIPNPKNLSVGRRLRIPKVEFSIQVNSFPA